MVSFAAAIGAGTLVLLLPFSTASGNPPGLLTALFTATSAVCVTGLVVVDTGSYWSPFGQFTIMVLFQLGGLGFMTLASLVVLAVSRRIGLKRILVAQTERRSLSLGDVRSVLRGVALITLVVESCVAAVMTGQLMVTYDYPLGRALWHGTFHAISAFNNAGFGLYEDSLMRFVSDPVISGALILAIVIGGFGFPVFIDLYHHFRAPQRLRLHMHLSLHSRLTLVTLALLLVVGFVAVLGLEWRNQATLGPMAWHEKGIAGAFTAVTPRTAGFNVVETGALTNETLFIVMVLMFIGAGSAGTSGGIKVSTFVVIGLVILTELRGQGDVNAFGRRIPYSQQRQAITVAALSLGVVVVVTLILLSDAGFPFIHSVFESTSAFGTVGLSMGITPDLPPLSQIGVMATMLIGRVGPATLGSALVLRRRMAPFRYPEEGPIIG